MKSKLQLILKILLQLCINNINEKPKKISIKVYFIGFLNLHLLHLLNNLYCEIIGSFWMEFKG